jgi:hypothetical protein
MAKRDSGKGDGSGDDSQPRDQPSNEALLQDPTLFQEEEMVFSLSSAKAAFESTLKHLE